MSLLENPLLPDIGIEKDRYSRSLWISAEIEKDRVLGMQSYGLGEIEMFYLFQSPSFYLFQSFSIFFNFLLPAKSTITVDCGFFCEIFIET